MNRFLRWLINLRNVSRSERLLRVVEPHLNLPPTPRILELGAGLGGLSAILYERYRPRQIIVTDFDSNQVELARRYLTRRFGSLPDAMSVRSADALSLPFPDFEFDAVFAIGVLHHVEDRHADFVRRPRAIAEIRRVLSPGGSFVYTEFTRTDDVRRSLTEQGLIPIHSTTRFGHQELDIYRAPSATTPR